MKREYYPFNIEIKEKFVTISDDNYCLTFKKAYYNRMVKEWTIHIYEWITTIS